MGFVGLARDEETFAPRAYLESLPSDLAGMQVFVLDPMLATGGTLVAANQLNVLVNNPGQLVRYMAAPIILGILLLPLLFVTRRRLETGHTAELPVTRVPEPGHDEGSVVEFFVDGGGHDPQRQA
jgi:hypothetical protein